MQNKPNADNLPNIDMSIFFKRMNKRMYLNTIYVIVITLIDVCQTINVTFKELQVIQEMLMNNSKFSNELYNEGIMTKHDLCLQNYLNNKYGAIIHQLPIFVCNIPTQKNGMGNYLGNYFEQISDAKKCGLHFVGVLNPIYKDTLFYSSMSSIIMHSNPNNDFQSNRACLKANTKFLLFPWVDDRTQWSNNLDDIGRSIITSKIIIFL